MAAVPAGAPFSATDDRTDADEGTAGDGTTGSVTAGNETAGNETAGNETAGERSDPESVARILCLRQLDARARTRAELAAYLARKGVPPEPAERVLDRFVQVGLIDDRALAESFVDSRHREAGLGRRALTQKLRHRGVDDDVIDAAVSDLDAESELAAARDLVRRRLRSVAGLGPQVQARRLVGMLARKGYAPGLAYRVVRESLADADLPAGADV